MGAACLAAWVLARAGARGEATTILRRLEAMPSGALGLAVGLMYARLGLGDLPGALDALEVAAVDFPGRVLTDAVVETRYDPVRSDPRFAAVLWRLNLDVARLTLPDGGRSR